MDYESKIAKYKELIATLNEIPKDLWDSSNYVQNWMYHNQLFLATFMSCSKSGIYSMEDLQLRKSILAVLEAERDVAKREMDDYLAEHPLEEI